MKYFISAVYLFITCTPLVCASDAGVNASQVIEEFLGRSERFFVEVAADLELCVTLTPAKEESSKTIIFLPGLATYTEKNIGLIDVLTGYDYTLSHGEPLENAADVWSIDPRAHGHSGGRLTDPSGEINRKCHIDSFEFYMNDLHIVITEKILSHYGKKKRQYYLMGESFGGHTILRYLQSYKDSFPMDIKGAIVLVPMVDMQMPPLLKWIGYYAARFACLLGYQEAYASHKPEVPGSKDFSSCKNHHNEEQFILSNAIVAKTMECITEGPTFGWVKASFDSIKALTQGTFPKSLPITLFIAGSDRVVIPDSSTAFAEQHNLKQYFYPDAGHKITKEPAEYNAGFWQDLDSSLK